MTEFADNNTIFASIKMTPFFANKEFHLRMSFSSDNIQYNIARKRLNAVKADNITITMQRVLKLMQKNSTKTRKVMTK